MEFAGDGRKGTGKKESRVEIRNRGLLEKVSFRKAVFSKEVNFSSDAGDSREAPECGEQGKSDHSLEILDNLEILEI